MENKKHTTIGFWGKNGDYGKFYSSIIITPDLLAMLKQAEVGGQLTLNYNTFEDRKPNSPDMRLGFVPKEKVQSRVKQAPKVKVESDI